MGMCGCSHKLSAPGGPPDVGRVRSERNTRGGSGSGKGSPAFTGQAILLFCRMRRGAHVPGRSQDHLRMNGVEKRQGGGGGPVSAPFKCTASARDNIVGSGRRPRSSVRRSLGPECPAFE